MLRFLFIGLFFLTLSTAFAGPSISEKTFLGKGAQEYQETNWVVKSPRIRVMERHYLREKSEMSSIEAKTLIKSIYELLTDEQKQSDLAAYRGFFVQPDAGAPIQDVTIKIYQDLEGARQTAIEVEVNGYAAPSRVVIRGNVSAEELERIAIKTIRNAEGLQHTFYLAKFYMKLMNRLYIDLAREDQKDKIARQALLERVKKNGYYYDGTLAEIEYTDKRLKARVPRLLGIAEDLRLMQEEYNALVSPCEARLIR